jgi:hypothetical protein
MRSATRLNPILRQAARGFAHLRSWVDYYAGARTQPSGCPARLIVHASRTEDRAELEALDRAS